MRILHVVESLDDRLGGLPRAAVAIAEVHARLGHDVVVATLRRPGDVLERVATLDPRVHVEWFEPSGPLARFSGSRGLRRWSRRHLPEFDLVHVHSTWNLVSAATLARARRHGARRVISPHGSLDDYDLAKKRRVKAVLGPLVVRRLLEGATVIGTSEGERRALVTFGATVEAVVAPLPPEPAGTPADRSTTRAALGVPEDVDLVVFLGRIHPKKGLDRLIRSVAATDAHLVVAGTGTPGDVATTTELADGLGMTDRVHLTGWVGPQQRWDLLGAADVFALLSERENWCIAAVEAALVGVPVLLSDQVWSGEVLATAGAAVVTPTDPPVAGRALADLLADDDRRARMSAAGRALTSTALSPETVEHAYAVVLRNPATD